MSATVAGPVAAGAVPKSLVDEFLPVYDVSDSVATVVAADVATTWSALMDVDLLEVGRCDPVVGFLGVLRILPDVIHHVLHGQLPSRPAGRLTLRNATLLPQEHGGWILLGERPGDEIALGLVGRFWRPVIQFAAVPAAEFMSFDQPGYAKTVYALAVQPANEHHTLLTAVMRTATTDDAARRWFRRYWTLGIGSGAHVLVNALLEVARDSAESRWRKRPADAVQTADDRDDA